MPRTNSMNFENQSANRSSAQIIMQNQSPQYQPLNKQSTAGGILASQVSIKSLDSSRPTLHSSHSHSNAK